MKSSLAYGVYYPRLDLLSRLTILVLGLFVLWYPIVIIVRFVQTRAMYVGELAIVVVMALVYWLVYNYLRGTRYMVSDAGVTIHVCGWRKRTIAASHIQSITPRATSLPRWRGFGIKTNRNGSVMFYTTSYAGAYEILLADARRLIITPKLTHTQPLPDTDTNHPSQTKKQ